MSDSKIKELENLVGFGLALGMALDKSLADDGKITFADAGNLVDPIMKAPSAFLGAEQALAELKSMTEDQKKELNDFVKAQFDIKNDKLEAVVEESVSIAVSAARIVALLKSDPAQAPAPVA